MISCGFSCIFATWVLKKLVKYFVFVFVFGVASFSYDLLNVGSFRRGGGGGCEGGRGEGG